MQVRDSSSNDRQFLWRGRFSQLADLLLHLSGGERHHVIMIMQPLDALDEFGSGIRSERDWIGERVQGGSLIALLHILLARGLHEIEEK